MEFVLHLVKTGIAAVNMKTTLDNQWVQKLINDLKAEGIQFSFDTDETDVYGIGGKFIKRRKLENVVFEKNGKKIKIYNGLFFRHGGLCEILDKDQCGFYKTVPVTDAMFYAMHKEMISLRFKSKT